MTLEPMAIGIDLKGALSKKNIRVNVPSTFTVGISTKEDIMIAAAERLLGLRQEDISKRASDIIFGQLRQVIATMTIEEINADRDKFILKVTESVGSELAKIGLEVINVNIINVSDESGYIEAIGQKAAAEAINQANIDVAQQDKYGQVGVSTALQEKEVSVAEQKSRSTMGQKEAERTQRVRVSALDAEIIQGENAAKALVSVTNAELAEKQAEATRRGEVAKANAEREVFEAQKATEVARLQMAELAKQEVEKIRIQIEADMQAEQTCRLAAGEADAIMLRYHAEAEGLRKVLQAKAEGYKNLIDACGTPQSAANLLLIEKMAELVAIQVEAIKHIKIDKLTVWDGSSGEGKSGALSSFLRDFGKMTPPLHEIAQQAGLKLPEFMGTLTAEQ